MKTASQIANLIAKNEWKDIIKLRAEGLCELCKRPGRDAHHIFKKKSNYMKTLLDNGIFLCFTHHRDGIHSPDWGDQKRVSDMIYRYKGAEEMERLQLLKNNPPKMSASDLLELRKEYKDLLTKL